MALVVPPSAYIVHRQFNLLYQFWIHTEVIDRLGPLEWILNTPSHHRVHHGRNPYCIDKNYGEPCSIYRTKATQVRAGCPPTKIVRYVGRRPTELELMIKYTCM